MNNNSNIVEKKISNIISRIEFIKNVVNGKDLDPMINFNNLSDKIINDKNISKIINKKDINIENVIYNIGNNLQYIKSGSTGHTFKGTINNDNEIYNYAVKIVPYTKKDIYGDEYSSTRPENTELLILKNLSFFVINNYTPHIILPITTFYTEIDYLEKLFKKSGTDTKKVKEYLKEYKKKDNYYDKISVLISEWANGGDLLDYLRINYTTLKLKEWRIIFFQIISTLAIIQTKYPNFRHNDLKANNILVYNLEITDNTKYFIYNINGIRYMVPNIGI
jgi:hypothetical protein